MSHSPSSLDKSILQAPARTPLGKEIAYPEGQFTPIALDRLSTLKRKVNEESLSKPPPSGDGYIKWRLLVVRAELDVVRCTRESLKESFRLGKPRQEDYERYRANTFDKQDELEGEEMELPGQGKFH